MTKAVYTVRNFLPAEDAYKTTSERAIQKKAKANGYLIGNKIADKITKVSRTPLHNSSETITNETENTGPYSEIPKKRQQIIYDLRLIQ